MRGRLMARCKPSLVMMTAAAMILIITAAPSAAQLSIDFEGGLVGSVYNDVRIPGDGGTDLSLTDDLTTDPGPFFRARLTYAISDRHTLSALYAPLTLTADGTAPADIIYDDVTFTEGSELEGSYTFNSYRLTYRYEFTPRGKWSYGIGFTGKIRDAAIKIESEAQVAEKTNVGFVPLINFRIRYDASEKLSFSLEGDALAAPQGRAEDVMLAAHYRVTDAIELRAGYRFVEGGADNDEVYNFTYLSYGLVGVSVSF